MRTPQSGSREPGHYLLIKKEGYNSAGKRITARESALALLNTGFWPLWEHTKNRCSVQEGDLVAVYLSGSRNQKVIASAKISCVRPWDKEMSRAYPLMLDGVPFSSLSLDSVNVFVHAIPVQSRLSRLSFYRPMTSWGVYFMGGVRKLTRHDFVILTDRE